MKVLRSMPKAFLPPQASESRGAILRGKAASAPGLIKAGIAVAALVVASKSQATPQWYDSLFPTVSCL
jgi:hypothetical protein